MASTTSLSWPNMFDISRNTVGVVEDTQSVSNRTKLLIMSEPSSLYMNPNFGVGLKQHLFKYKTENEKQIIKDKIVNQLRLHEPCADIDKTKIADGLLFTGNQSEFEDDYNHLKLTLMVVTTFGDTLDVTLNG